jgi:hypothetical protein
MLKKIYTYYKMASSFKLFKTLFSSNHCEKVKTDDPRAWGPNKWLYLHMMAENYDENPSKEEIETMKTYIEIIPETLPCKKCGLHFKDFTNNYCLSLEQICSNRKNLVEFFKDAHNNVNEMLGKRLYSTSEVYKKYKFAEVCN